VITPIIPLYVQDMGGSAFLAGVALLSFSVPSFVVRPIVGHIADKWSAAGVLAVGLGLLSIGALLFLIPVLAMVFVGGLVRGLGWAAANAGGYTILAVSAPELRRGEAAGYYTSVTTSASIAFPALALWLIGGGGFHIVFLLSAILSAIGVPIVFILAKNKTETKTTTPTIGNAGVGGLIDRGVLVATALNLCSTLAMPSLMAFLPLYARSLGIEGVGSFYVLSGITGILIRPVLGKKSDAMGRRPAIALGLCAELVGFLLVTIAQNLTLILIGGFFVAVGMAMIGSATTALAMDLVHPHSRGRGMATFGISFQIGFGAGAIISGTLADLVGLRAMYLGSVAINLVGLIVLMGAWKSIPRRVKS
jgi:MFS family permease